MPINNNKHANEGGKGMTSYKIDFYELSITPTTSIQSPKQGFKRFENGEIDCLHTDSAYTRELYGLTERSGNSWGGLLRKFRTENLPVIAMPGGDAEDIELEENEGLVEQNSFVFYTRHNLLGWQLDGHGNHIKRFERFLAAKWGCEVRLLPVIQPDAIKRLMAGGVELKSINVTLPRPTNPDLYPNNDFGGAISELLSGSNADSIHLRLAVDLRRGKTSRLADTLRSTMKKLTKMNPSTAKVAVFEDGIEHTIDLIADRVSSVQETDTDGRVAAETLYSLIDVAKSECQGVLDEYFGTDHQTLG